MEFVTTLRDTASLRPIMNVTPRQFADQSSPDSATTAAAILPASTRLRRGASKAALILGGFTAMGYLMALSFFRLG